MKTPTSPQPPGLQKKEAVRSTGRYQRSAHFGVGSNLLVKAQKETPNPSFTTTPLLIMEDIPIIKPVSGQLTYNTQRMQYATRRGRNHFSIK